MTIDQLFSINLSFIIIGLTLIEKKRINRVLTPFTMTAWPFLLISLGTNFIFVNIGFRPVSARAQLFILANLLIIWIIGYYAYIFYSERLNQNFNLNKRELFKDISRYQLFIIVLSWIIIIINYRRVSEIIDNFGGIWILGSEKFEKLMGKGFISHFVELGKVCFLLLIFSYRHSKYKFLTIATLVALFLNTASIMVKYHVIWLITISFLFYVWDRPAKQQTRNIIILSLILFFAMNSFWIFLTFVWGTFAIENEFIWLFFGRLFVNYFVSGPVVLDFWLDLGSIKPDWTLFVVFENIWNVIIGHPQRIEAVPLTSHGFYEVAPGSMSNVGTSFGVYYLIGGYVFSFAITTVFAFVAYVLFYVSLIKKNKVLLFLNLLFLNLALFSFFGQYFTSFTFYEMSIMFIMMLLIFKISDFIIDIVKT